MIQAILVGLLVLAAPGGALLLLLPDRFDPPGAARRDPLARLADSAALSIAILALLGMVGLFTGIRYTQAGLAAFYGACAVVGAAAWAVRAARAPGGASRAVGRGLGQALVALAVLAAFTAWRLYQSRDLALPAWVDSVHHTLIVRVIMETGGLPWDLNPYLNIPFYYHYGFHLAAAVFSSLAGLSAPQGVLWFGQAVNACVALSVYRLGVALVPGGEQATADAARETRLRAALAALLVTFSLQMPAYYLTWGRYTLLAGLVLLGPVMAAAVELWKDGADRGARARYVLLLAGTFTTHYLVVLLVGLFLGVLAVAALLRRPDPRGARRFPWALVLGGLLAVLFASPWVWRLVTYTVGMVGVSVGGGESVPGQGATPEYLRYLYTLLGPRHNYFLMAFAALGLVFGARRAELRPLAAWAALLVVQSLPWSVQIKPFRPDLYLIVLFFPAALFLAELLLSSGQAVGQVWRPAAGRVALALSAALLLGWGLWSTRDVINRATILADRADVAALAWVAQNTPTDARFWINAVPWQTGYFRGVDGGYWLLPYTGRASLIPPAIYGAGSLEYIHAVGDLGRRAGAVAGCTPNFWTLARDARLTHVYLRQGSGKLQPAMLQDCKRLRPVYSAGGVWVYEILYP